MEWLLEGGGGGGGGGGDGFLNVGVYHHPFLCVCVRQREIERERDNPWITNRHDPNSDCGCILIVVFIISKESDETVRARASRNMTQFNPPPPPLKGGRRALNCEYVCDVRQSNYLLQRPQKLIPLLWMMHVCWFTFPPHHLALCLDHWFFSPCPTYGDLIDQQLGETLGNSSSSSLARSDQLKSAAAAAADEVSRWGPGRERIDRSGRLPIHHWA